MKRMLKHNILQYGVAAYITFAAVISHSAARDLRPSEHGLANQRGASSPVPPYQNGNAQKMLSFFSSATPSEPLPVSQSIGAGGDTWWSVRSGGGSRDLRRDRVRLGLLVAAAICGFAGMALLVVSGVVYHLRRRREKGEAERLSELYD